MPGHAFQVLPGQYAVCRLAPDAARPAWAVGDFVSVTATGEELSVICPAEAVPADVQVERNWRVLKVAGPFALDTVGVLAALAVPLAAAQVSVLTVGTFDTDYLLVKADALDAALRALAAAGHRRRD
jgi:hypothetical protein